LVYVCATRIAIIPALNLYVCSSDLYSAIGDDQKTGSIDGRIPLIRGVNYLVAIPSYSNKERAGKFCRVRFARNT